MVPLDEQRTVLDWICALDAPVLLVVGDYLGTLSHTLTAVEVLCARGVEIAAVIINEGEDQSVPFEDTRAEIALRVAPVPVLALRRGADGHVLEFLL